MCTSRKFGSISVDTVVCGRGRRCFVAEDGLVFLVLSIWQMGTADADLAYLKKEAQGPDIL